MRLWRTMFAATEDGGCVAHTVRRYKRADSPRYKREDGRADCPRYMAHTVRRYKAVKT